jgi:hypothetical protein
MFQFLLRRPGPAAVAVAGMAVACAVHAAQGTAQAPKRPDPLNADAPVPALVFRSSLANHRRLQDQAVGSWSQANETVNRIGGWRTYAREASRPDAATTPPASAAPSALPAKP